MRRGPVADVHLVCRCRSSRCHYQHTWLYNFIDCLIGYNNESRRTPGSHVLYLCFNPGCVQSRCYDLVFKLPKAGFPASRDIFEKDGVVSVVEVREIFICDVYSQITDQKCSGWGSSRWHGGREQEQICNLDGHRMLWGNCQIQNRVLHDMWFQCGSPLWASGERVVYRCSAGLSRDVSIHWVEEGFDVDARDI